MRFLVTGGAGFIGSHLCERLMGGGHQVLCLDNFNTYYDPKIKRRNIHSLLQHRSFTLAEIDIVDQGGVAGVFKNNTFDIIVHLAARAGVRPSIKDPALYQRVNIEGTLNLLQAAVEGGVQKFILASSSSVYGNNEKVPFSEDDPVDNPISPYAATKKACELIGYTFHHLYHLPVTCLRFFTVYGPRQRPDMAIHKFAQAIQRGEPIPLFGDGKSRRDYTYIDDIIDGVMKAIDHCSSYHIYNLGESQTTELLELIALLEELIGRKAKIEKLPMQPGDVPITYADITRAREELDYRPRVPVREGLRRFIGWLLDERRD